MDRTMVEKIDAILDRVKEPESGQSVAELGLVERVRWVEKRNKLVVFTKPISSTHGCCTMLALVQQNDVNEALQREFRKEFPLHYLEFVGNGPVVVSESTGEARV